MARRLEMVCATCKHLVYAYKNVDNKIMCECRAIIGEFCFIPITSIWNEKCDLWVVKE